MEAVSAGDSAAFGRLYDELSPAVFGSVVRVVRSHAHAEEVTQEVFLEVWRKAASWELGRGSAAAWVLMIARARATDRVRSEQAARDRQERVAPSWLDPGGDDVADQIVREDERDAVRGVLDVLTVKQRAVIELAYFRGWSYHEVAGHLNIPVGTVKTRMRDGLMRLRRAYGAGE